MNFEMMLISFLPCKYFSLFLEKEMPQFNPYLQMIQVVRLYSEATQSVADTETEINTLSGTSKSTSKFENQLSKHQEKAKNYKEQAFRIAK